MKYPAPTYAKALLAVYHKASADQHSHIVKNFIRVLVKNGDVSSLAKIEVEIQKQLVKQKNGRMILVETARDLDDAVLKKIFSKFSTHDHVESKINPSLVAGVRVSINGEQELDISLARRLHSMFS